MRIFAPLLMITALAAPVAAAPLSKVIAAAVADPARPAEGRAVDPLRKPAETLAFSGVKPGMIVGEFYPGGGYFTRMIAGVVGPKGHVYALENQGWKGAVKANQELFAECKKCTNVTMDAKPFGTVSFPKLLDLAWITQNYHDLKIAEYGKVDTVALTRLSTEH
jgi:predicted methyltransferase